MMPPAWERHDFAEYARTLVRVRRLNQTWRVLLICAFGTILVPLVLGLLDWRIPTFTPVAAFALVVVATAFKSRADRIQVKAIATWVAAGTHNQLVPESPPA